MEIKYIIKKSNRRQSCKLAVTQEGTVEVSVPSYMTDQMIQDFLHKNQRWIEEKVGEVLKNRKNKIEITPELRAEGIAKAKEVIPQRVRYFAWQMGLEGRYHRITIREQKTRWGSCSSKGNLNFNWKLMLMPPGLVDYVVVHELAHLVEMNHSSRFWKVVERQMPDYAKRQKQLNELGKRYL